MSRSGRVITTQVSNARMGMTSDRDTSHHLQMAALGSVSLNGILE